MAIMNTSLNASDYWKLPKKREDRFSRFIFEDVPTHVVRSAHHYKWFGLYGLKAKESLSQYGIAARCLDLEKFEYECYAPDPDEDDCSIYFITTEEYIEEHLQKSPQLASFVIDTNVSLREFKLMDITDKLLLICNTFDVIKFLELDIDECYERDSIELGDLPSYESNDLCGEESIAAQDLSIDKTEEISFGQIVSRIVEKFGKGIVKEKKFINVLADFKVFKSNPALKRILKVLIEDGYTERWANFESLTQGETFALKEASIISQLYGFKESLIKDVITDLLSPLGLITDKIDAGDEVNVEESNLSMMGYGDLEDYYEACFVYEFEENKEDEYLEDKQGILYSKNKAALVLGNIFEGNSYYVRYGTKFIANSAWQWDYDEVIKQPLTLHLPDTLIAIGESAFENVKFTHLEIPSSVKLLLDGAFNGCKFDKLTLNEGIEYIDRGAFQFTNLKSIELPSSTKYVGANAFPLGIRLTSKSKHLHVDWRFICDKDRKILFCNYSDNDCFILPDTIEVISDYVFFLCDMKEVVLSKSLHVIGDSAFSRCENLQNIKLPDTLESIGKCAFENCTNLYSIAIPPRVKYIGEGAFKGCNNLSNVISMTPHFEVEDDALYDVKNKVLLSYFGIDRIYKVRKGTKIIGESAFYGSPNLQSIELPSSVEVIRMWAFKDCPNLRSVKKSNPKCVIEYYAFSGCPCEKNQISTNKV